MLDPAIVLAARERIASRVHRTPMLRSSSLSAVLGIDLAFKAELFQRTGSFKVRGALHKLSCLSADAAANGLVTISAGNHAAALAYAAREAGLRCTVVMPQAANPTKVRATEAYGAEVVLHGSVQEAFVRCHELEKERGLLYIHAFDDPEIVAGAGTLGLEVLEQVPELDTVLVPIGGGGLISGVALAVKHLRPRARVIGVEPEGAAVMWASLEAGRALRVDQLSTLADGLAPPMVGELNFQIVQRYVDGVVKVSDAEILDAMRLLMSRCKLVVEPAGAAAFAALMARRVSVTGGERVVVVLSGGNVDLAQLGNWL